MATQVVDIPAGEAYVEVASGTDFFVSNRGSSILEFVFADALPPTTTKGHPLAPYQGVQKLGGVPVGNLYARSTSPFNGQAAAS